jgi:Mrp family chromosome partitioning ATPase
LKKFGFPVPDRVPTEVEEALLQWNTDDAKEQQGLLLQSLNVNVPNNAKQQVAFDTIMESIDNSMVEAGRDDMTAHIFHIITGPGGTGKSALFRKLHAACRSKGLLISICAATGLAALLFDGATTAHSLFNYPVVEEDDVDDQDCPQCKFNKQRSDFLKQVSVIFWDEFISSDRMVMEAVLETFKSKWKLPRYYVFICAGDFAQVSVLSRT